MMTLTATAFRRLLVGLTAFLTLVDLFATQAILPFLAAAYGVRPAAMALAVNASTFGMAAAALGVALLSQRIDRRHGIVASLALLSIPTALLAIAPDLATFAALRVAQGVFMVSAFVLMLAWLGESFMAEAAGGVFAAYVAGNVASNLFGRMLSAATADALGLAPTFLVFAGLNLAGALLVAVTIERAPPMAGSTARPGLDAWRRHLADPALRASFATGFCILFAFIGTFTYVNFQLTAPPIGLSRRALRHVLHRSIHNWLARSPQRSYRSVSIVTKLESELIM